MPKINAPLFSFNRGLISEKALGRVDLERTRLSSEVYKNWLPDRVGSMSIRPGTIHQGSSRNDTGAYFIEFIASTDDVALCELTDEKMRLWVGDDAHSVTLLERPSIATTLDLTDTGWYGDTIGGSVATTAVDLIPVMTGPTTDGVTITASSQNTSSSHGGDVWHLGDKSSTTAWADTGANGSTLPSWANVDFGSGNAKTITSYSIRASGATSAHLDNAPETWRLLGSDYDTGTYATDTGKISAELRHWRLYITSVDGDIETFFSGLELFDTDTGATGQVNFGAQGLVLNATATGSLARLRKRVVVDTGDVGVEHSLALHVERGPVTMRVGSSEGDDDYISESTLRTGYHNLAFTPNSNFHITIQTTATVNRIIKSVYCSCCLDSNVEIRIC